MNSKSSSDPHQQDEEIIELTDIVQDDQEAEDTQNREGTSSSQETDELLEQEFEHLLHKEPSSTSDTTDQEAEDDLDFSSLFSEQEAPEQDQASSRSTRSSRPDSGAASQDFAGFDDIFDELDFAPYADQESQPTEKHTRTEDRLAQLEHQVALLSGQEDSTGHLKALEQRISRLEEVVHSQQAWQDIEQRIMSRLQEMVDQRIQTATQELHPTSEQASVPETDQEQLQELAQSVEELRQHTVGSETVAALKNELWTELSQRIEDTLPAIAAKVIREEIQAMLSEEGEGEEGPA